MLCGFLCLLAFTQCSVAEVPHVLGLGLHSILWLNNAPLCGRTTFWLSIYLLMDLWGPFLLPAMVSHLTDFDCF